jgi:S1-C subfamily serine protease
MHHTFNQDDRKRRVANQLRIFSVLALLVPSVCFGITNLSLDLSLYRLITIDGVERWAKLSSYPVIKKTDRIRVELNSNRDAKLVAYRYLPRNSERERLFDLSIEKNQTSRVPENGKWLDLSGWSAGKQQIYFSAKSGYKVDGNVLEVFLIESIDQRVHSMDPSMTKAVVNPGFATAVISSSKTTDQKPSSSLNTLVVEEEFFSREMSSRELEDSLQLVSATQRFVEFEFLGSKQNSAGVDIYKETASGVVKLLIDDGTCSGAILDSKGTIVTNAHCIGENNVALLILKPPVGIEYTFTNFFTADVLRTDSKRDLALLRIRNPPEDLKPIVLGDLSRVDIGMFAHAIGHPLGHDWSYTVGTVSQIRPQYVWGYGEGFSEGFKATVVQTQTPSNPGNSGGPLFSNAGELIGINSFGLPEAQGINFAVAVNHVKNLMVGVKKPELPPNLEPIFMGALDTDDNGVDDFFVFDSDRNNKPDFFAIDENEDGEPDYWLLDENENGIYDGRKYKDKYKGIDILITLKDLDEDGQPDLQGIDLNADGKVDEYISLLDSQ